MSTTSLFQTVGGMAFPSVATDVSTADKGLQGLDPARDTLLELLKSAVNDELGEAWAAAQTYFATGELADATLPIVDTVPKLPTADFVQQRKQGWPCLFLDRDLADPRNAIEEHTLWQERLVQYWGLHYILPPLDAGDRRKVEDILIRVVAVVHLTLKNLRHPSYRSGAYLIKSAMGLSSLDLVAFRAGQAKFAEDASAPTYTAMSMTLRTTELTGFAEGTEAPFSDITLQAGTGNGDGIIPELISAKSEVPLQSS